MRGGPLESKQTPGKSVQTLLEDMRSSLDKVFTPRHHISIDRPVLECGVIKVKGKGGSEGI
jgi:hypothetical protein